MINPYEPKMKPDRALDAAGRGFRGFLSMMRDPLGAATALLAGFISIQAVSSLKNDDEREGPYDPINKAFCTDGDVRPPYLSWKSVPFRIEWDNKNEQYVQTFTFDFNESAQTNEPDNTIEGFAASIPQDVRDNPDMFLVITGHASRETQDTDDEFERRPNRTHLENREIAAQRALNNRKVAQARIDSFVTALDWPEGRMRLQNLETTYNKREVNVQICMLGEPE